MQASLEAEARGKAEAMRVKKKLEQDINELEVALDTANRGRADAEKNIKKYQQQIRELQQQVSAITMMMVMCLKVMIIIFREKNSKRYR